MAHLTLAKVNMDWISIISSKMDFILPENQIRGQIVTDIASLIFQNSRAIRNPVIIKQIQRRS